MAKRDYSNIPNEEIGDFNNFLGEFIANRPIDDDKVIGIIKLVIEKGFNSLSDKQKYVFENAVDDYVFDMCPQCEVDVLWCDIDFVRENGCCTWCTNVTNKDD